MRDLGSVNLFADDEFPSLANNSYHLEQIIARAEYLTAAYKGCCVVTGASSAGLSKPASFCKEYTSLDGNGGLGSRINNLPPGTRIGPVLDMMGIHGALTGTTGKAEAVIPAF